MSTKIQLSPEELIAQSDQLLGIMDGFEGVFNTISQLLKTVNSNWSENLANNFLGKITSAQNGFAEILGLLSNGAQAARNSANTMMSIDSSLAQLMDSASEGVGKVTLSGNSGKEVVTDAAKDLWSDAVDARREQNGTAGKTWEYSSSKPVETGYQSVLGTDFAYEKYLDYRSGSISTTEGDDFYRFAGGLDSAGQKTEFHSADGSGISGDFVTNGMGGYANGEFDLAKGNAYVQAGAEYTMMSGSVAMENEAVKVGVGAGLGVGAHLNTGFHNGVLSVDVGVGFGPKVDLDFELNYGHIWEEACDFGNYVAGVFGFN